MKKSKLWPEINNLLGIDSSHKIPPPLVTRKFRQNRRKSIISRDICKKRNYGPKSKTIWELILLITYFLLWWPENFVKIAVKPLFHKIYAENEIMARNQNPFENWCFSWNTSSFGDLKISSKSPENHYFTRYMQKTNLWSEIKNHLGIDSSHKIPPPF